MIHFYTSIIKSRILFFGIVILLLQSTSGLIFSQDYGLHFNGQNVKPDDRTELDLTPNGFIKFNEEFEISFDVKVDLDQKYVLFGYVLRIISEDNQNIDLLFSNTLLQEESNVLDRKLNLVIGNTETLVPLKDFNFSKDNWVNIRVKFLLDQKELIFYTSDSQFIKKPINFKKNDAFKILFGANDYEQFATSDVAIMSIKDIKLYQRGKLLNQYPLNQCGGSKTLDSISKKEAVTKNADWLLCKHQEWEKLLEYEAQGVVLVTANRNNGDIYLLNQKELTIFSSSENTKKTVEYLNGDILLNNDHRAIFNNLDGKIYCYLLDKRLYSSLDVETGLWSESNTFTQESYQKLFQHHNSIFNASDNSIYTFGGYGQYKYRNNFRKINLDNGVWEDLKVNNDVLLPRYLAGVSILNDTIYILGGYGSASGNQLINPKSYYGLISYSIASKDFTKKFEIQKLIDDMIVSNSIWIDSINRNYYALISDKNKFDGNLQLMKGNLDSPEAELVGNKIPYKFLDVKSFSGLYFFSKQNKLFAYTTYLNDFNSTELNLYSINYPVKVKTEPIVKPIEKTTTPKYIIAVLILIFGVFLGVVFYKKANKSKSIIDNDINIDEDKEEVKDEIDFNPVLEKQDHQIIFFGGFQIINKEQKDITNKFSPLLKELFLLIWLYTFKNNKGISSEKLIDFIWYDKPPRRAQNNRSVNITKLRTIMRELGACEITKETGYWKINHDYKILKSDYYELIHITDDKKNISKDRIDHIINITKKGPFLSNLEYEWLDQFKADISEKIINTLIEYAETVDIKRHPNFTIRLSDCVFNFDSINEEAMMYKCKAQYLMGKHSLAETTYKKFTKEYKLLYDQEYEYSFTNVLDKV